MQIFTKVFAAAVLATLVSASPVTDVEEHQLSGLPLDVCLAGVAPGGLDLQSILDIIGLNLISCTAGETCTALDIPIIGSLLPVGTCTSA